MIATLCSYVQLGYMNDGKSRQLSLAKARFPLPELTGDRFPLPVNTGRVDGRAFPLAELMGQLG